MDFIVGKFNHNKHSVKCSRQGAGLQFLAVIWLQSGAHAIKLNQAKAKYTKKQQNQTNNCLHILNVNVIPS